MANVVWFGNPEQTEYHAWWDTALLHELLSDYTQHEGIAQLPDGEGAIVVLPTRLWTGCEQQVSDSLQRLKFVLLILAGDEEATFDWRAIRHPRMKVWVMMPRMNQHDDASHLLHGYAPNTRSALRECGQQVRDIDYFFCGQVNHPRREGCRVVAEQFKGVYPSAVVIPTATFAAKALEYPEYMKTMARSKIVLCPSGVESPDSFRLYEALEAGCIPVVDAFSTKNQTPGYWKYLFGSDIPFPIVNYWDELPAILPHLLANYKEISSRCFAWWMGKKKELKYNLDDDYKKLNY